MSELTTKCIDYLRVIDENGGRATTTQIRNATGMSNSAVNYRHDKLKEMGYVEVERDPNLTPKGMSAGKRAMLTDFAKDQIGKGLLVEAKQETEEKASVETNAERLDDIEDTVENIRDVFENEISPDLVKWRDLTVQILLYLDQLNGIDISLQDVIELEVDEETATYVIRRVQKGPDDGS